MPGFTIGGRDATLLREVVAAAGAVEPSPLPWSILEQVKVLLDADAIAFNELDTVECRHPSMQGISAEGQRSVASETPEQARSSRFWAGYWSGPCSRPQRTGDYLSVTTLANFLTLREVRRMQAENGAMDREIVAYLPSPYPGRHAHLLAWRTRGIDFGERERFYLSLLRPHLVHAYWAGLRERFTSPELTPRQRVLLDLVRDGYTNVQIARRLGLSEGTVRTHLNNIFERLEVTSRTAAVTKVYGGLALWGGYSGPGVGLGAGRSA